MDGHGEMPENDCPVPMNAGTEAENETEKLTAGQANSAFVFQVTRAVYEFEFFNSGMDANVRLLLEHLQEHLLLRLPKDHRPAVWRMSLKLEPLAAPIGYRDTDLGPG